MNSWWLQLFSGKLLQNNSWAHKRQTITSTKKQDRVPRRCGVLQMAFERQRSIQLRPSTLTTLARWHQCAERNERILPTWRRSTYAGSPELLVCISSGSTKIEVRKKWQFVRWVLDNLEPGFRVFVMDLARLPQRRHGKALCDNTNFVPQDVTKQVHVYRRDGHWKLPNTTFKNRHRVPHRTTFPVKGLPVRTPRTWNIPKVI